MKRFTFDKFIVPLIAFVFLVPLLSWEYTGLLETHNIGLSIPSYIMIFIIFLVMIGWSTTFVQEPDRSSDQIMLAMNIMFVGIVGVFMVMLMISSDADMQQRLELQNSVLDEIKKSDSQRLDILTDILESIDDQPVIHVITTPYDRSITPDYTSSIEEHFKTNSTNFIP